jgi:tetratricopeptide (TPR) repeat protein
MNGTRSLALLLLLASGCAEALIYDPTLQAPAGTAPSVVAAVEEGNRLYRQRKWEAARAQYEAAIKAQPTLAEAHYNLALVLEILEGDAKARPHYIEAANLAPGNQVIWNSPPLRRHGDVDTGSKPGRPLITPAMGVH